MKKLWTLALSVIAFLFVAAPIYMKIDSRPMTANGKQVGNAQFINGQWAISLEDFAKAAGGTLTLEPNFQLQGSRLLAVAPGVQVQGKTKIEASSPMNTIGGVAGNNPAAQQKAQGAIILQDKNQGGIILQNKDRGGIILQNTAFHVRKAGEISHNVFMFNGKAYVPLADVAKAFGGTFTAPAGNLTAGQSLNFNWNGDGILAFNQ